MTLNGSRAGNKSFSYDNNGNMINNNGTTIKYSMNARVYDPTIGRFTSADSIIPYKLDTQSYNRYSYVRNNLL